MRRLSMLAAVTIFVVAAAPAAPIVWTLQNVTFSDGGTATGSYVYDANTNTVTNWSIAVSGGTTATFPAFTYNTTTSNLSSFGPSATQVIFDDPSQIFGGNPLQPRILDLVLNAPMTNAGGVITLLSGPPIVGFDGSRECYNCSPFRTAVSGSLAEIPEPTSALLISSAFALMIAFTGLRRRRNYLQPRPF
jgi:hypothetical protein